MCGVLLFATQVAYEEQRSPGVLKRDQGRHIVVLFCDPGRSGTGLAQRRPLVLHIAILAATMSLSAVMPFPGPHFCGGALRCLLGGAQRLLWAHNTLCGPSSGNASLAGHVTATMARCSWRRGSARAVFAFCLRFRPRPSSGCGRNFSPSPDGGCRCRPSAQCILGN